MVAKSSIHFAPGGAGYFAHNDREKKTVNTIFNDEKNEYSCSSLEAITMYRAELSKRSIAYTNRTKQSLQKNAVTHRSAILNLHQHHTIEDLEPIIKKIEKDLDTKVLQVAIHRDEGHVENGEQIKNYHAHIEIMGLDTTGTSLAQHQHKNTKKRTTKNKFKTTRAKRLDSKYYRELQTFVADTLNMERGKVGSDAKRLDTYEYKAYMQKDNQTVTALNAIIEAQRIKMIGMEEFSKEDYRALSEIKKITKKSTLAEAYSKFYDYAERIETENKDIKKELREARETILVQKTTISSQKIEIELLEQSIELLEAKNNANFGMNTKIKEELISKKELLLAIRKNLSADMSPNKILDVIQAIEDNTEDLEVYNDDEIQMRQLWGLDRQL
jgi:hypothetical protein